MFTIRSFSISIACEQSEPRKNARASSETAGGHPAFASPLACLSRVYFSQYPPNGEPARGLVSVRLYLWRVTLDSSKNTDKLVALITLSKVP